MEAQSLNHWTAGEVPHKIFEEWKVLALAYPLYLNLNLQGTSPAVQWLRLRASIPEGEEALVGELRPRMSHGVAPPKTLYKNFTTNMNKQKITIFFSYSCF